MAKTKRVRSTPRTVASKIEPAKRTLEQAYLDLEPFIGNVFRMSQLASFAVERMAENPSEIERSGLALFAMIHLDEMIGDLRQTYRQLHKNAMEAQS